MAAIAFNADDALAMAEQIERNGRAFYLRGAEIASEGSAHELLVKLADWEQRLAFLEGAHLVAYHKLWEYAARRFGFELVDYIEDRPGIPPSPRHVGELQERIRREKIPLVLYSDLVHPDAPEKLAHRSGARALSLPQSVGSRPGTEDLASWFELWVSLLEEAGKEF